MSRIALLEPQCTDRAGAMHGWGRYELGSRLTSLDGGHHA